MERKKTSSKKGLKDLKNYLKIKSEKEEKNIKPKAWSNLEISDFFKEIIAPAFKTIKTEMLEFDFERIDYDLYTKKAVLKVIETLTHFIFKVEVDNTRREVSIFYLIKHRKKNRARLFDIEFPEYEKISFNEIGKVNQDFIISLFTEWFIKKDELIEKFDNMQEE